MLPPPAPTDSMSTTGRASGNVSILASVVQEADARDGLRSGDASSDRDPKASTVLQDGANLRRPCASTEGAASALKTSHGGRTTVRSRAASAGGYPFGCRQATDTSAT